MDSPTELDQMVHNLKVALRILAEKYHLAMSKAQAKDKVDLFGSFDHGVERTIASLAEGIVEIAMCGHEEVEGFQTILTVFEEMAGASEVFASAVEPLQDLVTILEEEGIDEEQRFRIIEAYRKGLEIGLAGGTISSISRPADA